jgi:hypothetical protein
MFLEQSKGVEVCSMMRIISFLVGNSCAYKKIATNLVPLSKQKNKNILIF